MSESKRPRGKYKTTNWADYNASLDEVEIIIGINGSHQNADAIVFDYGMENEKITVRLKKALVFFSWRIGISHH